MQTAALSLFLSGAAFGQSDPATSLPQGREQIYVEVINVEATPGIFKPAVRVQNGMGYDLVRVGERGLTEAMIYDNAALSRWAEDTFGQTDNPQMILSRAANVPDSPPAPTPAPTPTPTPTPTPPPACVCGCPVDTPVTLDFAPLAPRALRNFATV